MSFLKNPVIGPFLVLAASVTAAAAQPAAFDRGHNEGVRERARPDYDADGMPLGAFRLFPTLGLSAVSDDNIYAASSGAISDTIGVAAADLVAR
ncbi:MAG: outer membrane beta-barrel protein, partial [Hyphomonadaceae bacterium]